MPLPTFTAKVDGVDTVHAVDVNELQNEVAPTAAAALAVRYSTAYSSTATVTLTDASFPLQSISPSAARTVTLPAVSTANHGYYVVNRSTSYDITVNNAGAAFVGYVRSASAGIFLPDSTASWYGLSLPKFSTSTSPTTFLRSDGTLVAPAETNLTFTDVATNNASTSAHGFAPKVVVPAAGLLSVLAVANGETARSDKEIFDTTSPVGFGAAAPGTQIIAARRDHVHPGWATVNKLADETIQSDNTLNTDTELVFLATASTKYAIRGRVFFDTSATADFKYRFNYTGTYTTFRGRVSHILPGTTASVPLMEVAIPTTTVSAAGTGTTGGFVEIDAILHVTNAGSVLFQWCQDTSNASNTTVLAGSYLEYKVIA